MNEAILLRFLSKKCTSEDLRIIDQWVAADPENARWLFGLEELWSLKIGLKYSDETEIRKAWLRFTREGEQRRTNAKKHRLKKYVYLSAAVAVVLLLFAVPAVYFRHTNDTIAYKLNENRDVNEIHVPYGQHSTVKLADGTKVWLNSGSRLIYPTVFSSKRRIVKLLGEGFFEVEQNKKSPFVVVTGSISTKVLGTKFNVKAYQDEIIRISLLEGIIEVSSDEEKEAIRLSEPDQQIEIAANGLVRRNKVNSQAVALWTEGELYFENESLEGIAATLERKFKVNIVIRNEKYGDMVFNSRIQKNASLEDILNVLKGTRNIDYSIDEGNVIIH